MKNLKYSINAIILAGMITLTSCTYATPITETSLTKEDNIETSIGNKHYSEKVRKTKIVRESEIETETETETEVEQVETNMEENIELAADELAQELKPYCDLTYFAYSEFDYGSFRLELTFTASNENCEAVEEVPEELYSKINLLLNQANLLSKQTNYINLHLYIKSKDIGLDLSKIDVSNIDSVSVYFDYLPEDSTSLINLMQQVSSSNKELNCSIYLSSSTSQKLIQQLSENELEISLLSFTPENREIPQLKDLRVKRISLFFEDVEQVNINLALNDNTQYLYISSDEENLVKLGRLNITHNNPDKFLTIDLDHILITKNTKFSIDCNNYGAYLMGDYTDVSPFYDLEDAQMFSFNKMEENNIAPFIYSGNYYLYIDNEIYDTEQNEYGICNIDDAITVLEDYKEKSKVLK